MSEVLFISESEGIVTLTINRPKALNALNKEVISSIGDFFSSGYKKYTNLVAVLITGYGDKAFAAGADITEFKDLNKEQATDLSLRGKKVFDSIENFHLPVIAVIKGYALGGGLELAMACHMRIGDLQAKCGLPELSLGLVPGYSGTIRLTHLIGKAKALEALITGHMFNSEDALRLGLLNHIDESPMERAKHIVSKIKRNGPIAISKAIELTNTIYIPDVDTDNYESQIFGELMVSEEAKEGFGAFLEKRKANFRNKN